MLFWFYFPLFASSSSYHYVSALDIQQNCISEMDSGIKYIEFEKKTYIRPTKKVLTFESIKSRIQVSNFGLTHELSFSSPHRNFDHIATRF